MKHPKITYKVIGSGSKKIIVLHGLFGNQNSFSGLAAQWIQHYPDHQIVLLDLPGHGGSEEIDRPVDLSFLADAVVETQKTLFPQQKVDFWGHSLGGRIALQIRHSYPQSTGKITVFDMSPGPTGHLQSLNSFISGIETAPDRVKNRLQMVNALLESGIPKRLAQWLVLHLVKLDNGEFCWTINREAICASQKMWSATDLWETIMPNSSDIGFIQGADSDFLTEKDTLKLESLGCRVATIADAGHYLHMEKISQTREVIFAWETE